MRDVWLYLRDHPGTDTATVRTETGTNVATLRELESTGWGRTENGLWHPIDPLDPRGRKTTNRWYMDLARYYSTLPGKPPQHAVMSLAGAVMALVYDKTGDVQVRFRATKKAPGLPDHLGWNAQSVRRNVRLLIADGWLLPLAECGAKDDVWHVRIVHRGP